MAVQRSEVLDRNQALMESLEAKAARQTAMAYNQARRELLDSLLSLWSRIETGAIEITPARLLEMVRQANLIAEIDARLLELERQHGVVLRDVVNFASEAALQQVERELALLPKEIREGMRPFSRIDAVMVERFLPIALADAHNATTATALTLQRELQAGILQGESFPSLVKRLMGATTDEPSVWARGRTSAELMTRRTVIHANNAARVDYLRQAEAEIPGLQKQVCAVIQSNTTECCLRAHGQIKPIDEPFDLTGQPRFADRMMHTPFHWNCRTAIVAYHPVFERGGLTTANMRASAEAELRRRG